MPNPRVGLALGAGAARGLAHIGVLQVLQAEDIPVQIVTGTSAGAVVGALYAAGTDLEMLARLVEELDWSDLTNITLTKRGLISTDKTYNVLRMLTKDQNFEDLPFPTAVVATDLVSGEEVVLDSGPIALGVKASLSIPGIFIPVEIDGRLLVDGALVNRVPADLCRKMGADLVIAVDVGRAPLRNKIRNLPDVIMQTIDILEGQVARHHIINADILLRPKLGNITLTQLNRANEIIELGRQIALAHVGEIKKQLSSSG